MVLSGPQFVASGSGKFRLESLKFKRDRATGLMLEPSGLTAAPPWAPAHAAKHFAECGGRAVIG